ncbi:MAG: AAA family ATPase [bacterium]|nr:AAA family ATPase [bacterium]
MTEPTTRPADGATLTLIGTERDIVDRHKRRIKELTTTLVAMARDHPEWSRDSTVGEHRYPPPGFKQPRMATTLAVLGPRGSGKSTCMVDLIHKLSHDPSAKAVKVGGRKFGCLTGFLVVRQTVDCTLGPRKVPLGLSALMRLRRVLGLEHDQQTAWSYQGEERADPGVEAEQQAFKAMREAYMLSRLTAGRVIEGTSSGGAHFAQQASAAAAEALALPDRVADWLQQAAIRLGPEVEGFILVLDDVDLARDGLRGLVRSLLDELHQPRLILVLGVDLPRLESRVADSVGEDRASLQEMNRLEEAFRNPIELAAARDLLYKALPQQNREWLQPWKEEDRWAFPPRPALAFPDKKSLKDILLERTSGWGVAIRNPALLPGFPRSLENIWFALWGLESGKKATTGTREMLDTVEDYLAYLAEARGEHALGRRISNRPASAWARHLTWPEKPIGNFQWERLVTSALEGDPLLGFQAGSDALPLPERPSSAALWIELLLDLSLASGHLTSAELIRRFPSMSHLVDRAQIRTDFHRDEMAQELRQARGSVMAKLAWTRFDVALDPLGVLPEEFDAQVGLAPLREAAEGLRNAWPTILAQGLYLRRSEVLDDGQRAYDTDGHPDDADALLPRGVRPLVVFVDSLSRAPWRLFSETPRRRSLRTNALLTAGLVRAAYVDALERVFDALLGHDNVDKAARHASSEADRTWLDAMHDRGYPPIVEWSDDIAEDRFHALLQETKEATETKLHRELDAGDLPDRQAKHIDWEFVFAPYNALVGCLRAYTSSRAFRHLADPGFGGASD